jgi:alpha-beta hydrolase superfamily lysophospholipase
MKRILAIALSVIMPLAIVSCGDNNSKKSAPALDETRIDELHETVTTPDGVVEEQVTVDAGSGYPLDGLLALPNGGARIALVLVHGSGPSDKDETIGANKPFRDIAYALAEKGIAVLRYDKRTFAYGAEIAADADVLARLTVYDETIYDAVAAVKLMKERFEKVYVLGHSMGGGLLAEIGANGADCDGYIVMAGTPRKLYEMSAEQNLLYADELEASGNAADAGQIRAFVQSEMTKAAQLAGLSDDDALKAENSVFTMSAWYLRSFESIDTLGLHLRDGKPIMVMQGGRDRQVTENDLALWQSGLSAHPAAKFKLYPTLNHLMGEYKGEEVPFAEIVTREYAQPTPVSADVTNDISEWILSAK